MKKQLALSSVVRSSRRRTKRSPKSHPAPTPSDPASWLLPFPTITASADLACSNVLASSAALTSFAASAASTALDDSSALTGLRPPPPSPLLPPSPPPTPQPTDSAGLATCLRNDKHCSIENSMKNNCSICYEPICFCLYRVRVSAADNPET
uniref:Uncharacterized protein n=1 Tax=Oryza nivara TaxID=4536 RepID=A0A0E0H7R5_ORYNI